MSQTNIIQKYQLKVGESITVEDHLVILKDIPWDTRCPSDVQCVVAGYATATLSIFNGDDKTITEDLKIPADQNNLMHPEVYELSEGLKLVVGSFSPYPVSTTKIEQEDYLLELWLMAD